MRSSSTDPHANLALENKLFHEDLSNRLVLRFWQNTNSVFMGRFQDQALEVDTKYTNANGIIVLKRFTGGGTVFHDLGNLNVSFFSSKGMITKNTLEVSSSNVCAGIIRAALVELGIPVFHNEKRNSLYYMEKKIMGSASAVSKDNFIFHSSVLYNANLKHLNSSIYKNANYLSNKVVKSVREEVCNLKEFFPNLSLENIMDSICLKTKEQFSIS